MLNKEECLALHKQNNGKICWIDELATNDYRMVLKNEQETLYVSLSSEWDHEEQAQMARLCQAINAHRNQIKA